MMKPSAAISFNEMRTPCLLLDRPALDRNIARLSTQIEALGADLRPHVKTAKSIQVARRATQRFSGAITVSTVREAEYFFAGGFTDILYAVGISPEKIAPLAALAARGARITLVADSVAAIAAIGEPVAASGERFGVLIEIDVDGYRCGISSDDPAFLEIARRIEATPGLKLRGVMSYAGTAYDAPDQAGVLKVAETHRTTTARAATRLRDAGFWLDIASVGSTPTASFGTSAEGITEVRAGVYVFQDLYQVGLGVCPLSDVALSVLATVIGHVAHAGGIAVDAGGLALSKDRSTASQVHDYGYGLVCDAGTGAPIDDLIVASTGQEHGLIRHASGNPVDTSRFAIGSQLSILPNHACMTAAAHDRYFVLDEKRKVEAVWERCNGW